MNKWRILAAIAGAAIGMGASAQVIINEVLENPPGSGSADDLWEFIELYGRPNMDLTGYALALIKGGVDQDGDGIPDVAADRFAEIDEAFSLDGLTLGANGLLVLYNTNSFGVSSIPALLPPETNRAPFSAAHIPTTDSWGKLANDHSSTYLLVRRRPNHSIDEKSGLSVYAPGYAFRKDVNPDVDFDSELDCGMEIGVGGAPGAMQIESVQVVDAVAWSHEGGKEYTRSKEQEISDTPGFNPDGLSRVGFFLDNPERGWRFNSDGELVRTRMADEEFIYGELVSLPALQFNQTIDAEGYIGVKAPTDPDGPTYDGSCDPDDPSTPCAPAAGPYLFQDLVTTGYAMSPGRLNDADLSAKGGAVITQFRFVPGDFNFDGEANVQDFALIRDRLGTSLDETYDAFCPDMTTPLLRYRFEDRSFQQVVAMTLMSDGDTPDVVTQSDVDAHRISLGFGIAPDQNGDGVVNGSDVAWNTSNAIADINGDGVVDGADLAQLLASWG